MADDERHPDVREEPAKIVNVPIREFVDAGLLHHFNRSYFWPLGLFLTASWYDNEGETYRSALWPKIRAALDDEQVRVQMHDAANLEPPKLDALTEAIWAAFSADLKGAALEVLELRSYDPPALVISALTPDEQIARQRKAAHWITERAALIDRMEREPAT